MTHTPDTHLLALTALGATVTIDASGIPPAARDDLRRLWTGCGIRPVGGDARRPDAPVPHVSASADAESWPRELIRLSSAVTRAAIAERSADCIVFHAAAVADARGRVVVFVAPSGTGKSTLAAAFAGTEHRYVSDEAVAVAADGGVRAFPRPLSLRDDGADFKRPQAPDELGLIAVSADEPGLVLGGLVVLERVDAPHELETTVLSSVEALARVVPQTSALWRLGRPLSTLIELGERVGGIRLVRYSDAGDIVRAMTDGALVARDDQRLDGPVVERRTPVEVIRSDDGRLVLLHDTGLTVLSAAGSLVWERLGSRRPLAEIVDEAVRDGARASDVADRVAELVAAGLARIVDGSMPSGGSS